MLRIVMYFDDQTVASCGYGRHSHGGHQGIFTGGVAGIHDDRKVGEFAQYGDGTDIHGVPGIGLESADAAFAEDHVRVAFTHDIFRAHQQFLVCGGHSALKENRFLLSSDRFQQVIVLHVACSDLDDINVIKQFKLRDVHQFRDDRKASLLFRSFQILQSLFSQALESIWGSARFERAASEHGRAAGFHCFRDRHHLLLRFHRAGSGNEGEVSASYLGVADRNYGIRGMEFTVCLLIRFSDTFHIFNDIQCGDKADIQDGCVTDESEYGLVLTNGTVDSDTFSFQPCNKSFDLFGIRVLLQYYDHGNKPPKKTCNGPAAGLSVTLFFSTSILLQPNQSKPCIIACKAISLTALRLKKEFPSIKVVSRFHGIDLYNERCAGLRQPFKTLMAEELDALLFACRAGRDYFEKNWGRKGSVHYLGTKKRNIIEENPDSFIIVSCSNLIPLKRVELIISALGELPDDIKVRWHHYGDGPCRAELERQAEAVLGRKTNVEYFFEGFTENEKLIETYSEIRPWLFITASSSEGGAPVSIQEAFSLGIPCVGTAVGGIPELITDNHNGFLLSPEPDAKSIADALERFYRLSGEQRKAFRKNARETWSRSFDAEHNAASFSRKLLELLNER